MTVVSRKGHMKSPKRVWESRRDKWMIVALAEATLGDHAGGHLTSQPDSFGDFQYKLGETLHQSFSFIDSKIQRTCFFRLINSFETME